MFRPIAAGKRKEPEPKPAAESLSPIASLKAAIATVALDEKVDAPIPISNRHYTLDNKRHAEQQKGKRTSR